MMWTAVEVSTFKVNCGHLESCYFNIKFQLEITDNREVPHSGGLSKHSRIFLVVSINNYEFIKFWFIQDLSRVTF